MNKIIFLSIFLLCVSFTGCGPGVNITDIDITGLPAQIRVIVAEENQIDDMSYLKSKITLTKGGFTGEKIDFDITGDVPGTTYTLNNFSPALRNGQKYYLAFEEGAFGDYGRWTFDGSNDMSDPIVFEFTV